MLRRLRQLADEGKDFAFETTLASRSFAPWIARLRKEREYRFHLTYLWLPDRELAVNRVRERVRAGGHTVPPDDIRRRYDRGLSNFFALYMPIADSWAMYDNSSPPAKLVATKEHGRDVEYGDQKLWQAIQDSMKIMEQESEYAVGMQSRLMGIPISEITEILARVGRDTLARHKALGLPAVIWRDGKIVEIPPEEIEI
jgi:predicted ABC-type ATPase